MSAENGDRLNSWKEIGAYFGKAERTVKRWEARGLPVHRLPGASGSTVYAYAGELDRWLKSVNAASEPEAEAVEAEPLAGSSPANGAAAPASAISAKPPVAMRMALVLAGAALIAGAILFVSGKPNGPAGVADRSPTSPAVPAAPAKRHVPSPEVADLYLQGMYYWSRRTPDDLNRAVHLFNQAIAEDPNYAEAFVGLANCYNLLREYTLMPADEAYPKAKAAAERAIALDDTLAEAHASLAFGEFFWFWNAAKARRSFERALQLNPKSVTTHHWLGTTLMYMGEFELALERLTEAQRLDPESRSILADKGLVLYYAGRKEESAPAPEAACRRRAGLPGALRISGRDLLRGRALRRSFPHGQAGRPPDARRRPAGARRGNRERF